MFSPHKHRFTVRNERFEVRRLHPAQIVRHGGWLHAGGDQIEIHFSGRLREPVDLSPLGAPEQMSERHAKRHQKEGTRRFLTAKTLDQLIAEQGIKPIPDISVLAGAIPDEDVDEFVADIYRSRT